MSSGSSGSGSEKKTSSATVGAAAGASLHAESVMTKAEAIAIYDRLLATATTIIDGHGHRNANPAQVAYDGLRSEVHAALQLEHPVPEAEADEDPDLHHMRQKSYGKNLWKVADAIVAAAGVTPRGKAS